MVLSTRFDEHDYLHRKSCFKKSVECRAWQDFFDDTCEGRDCKEFGGGICRGSGREDPCKCDKVKCEDGHIIEL